MAKFYGVFAKDTGLPMSFYNDDIYPDVVQYGEKPEPTADDPDPQAPEISREPNPAIPSGAVVITEAQWQEFIQNAGFRFWDAASAEVKPYTPPPTPVTAPESATLGDWRVAMLLWTRDDGQGGKVPRLNDIKAAIAAAQSSGNPAGAIAAERLEYSNNVLLTELQQLHAVFGFTEAEVEESMWRAGQVSKGDLSGQWPLPAAS